MTGGAFMALVLAFVLVIQYVTAGWVYDITESAYAKFRQSSSARSAAIHCNHRDNAIHSYIARLGSPVIYPRSHVHAWQPAARRCSDPCRHNAQSTTPAMTAITTVTTPAARGAMS